MGTDLTHSIIGFNSICAHPWNPWLEQLRPAESVNEPLNL